ncbi:MAG: SpoIVB peptidase S55 domain-containing protein [bacterium]
MKKVLLLVALSVFALMGRAFAGDNTLDIPVFDLKDLKPGLSGKARTVIRGTKIEEFDVEVIELIPDGGFDGGPLILAHFTGPVVDHSNGIAGGYSGSPVYIDGKLLGAVSAAIPFTDTHVGGVTPISSMLAALPDVDEPDYGTNTVLPETENSGIPIDEDGNVISYVDSLDQAMAFNDAARAAGRHAYQAVLATTPLYVSGVNHKVFGLYEEQMRDMLGSNLELIEKPSGSSAGEGLFLRQESDGAGLLLESDTSGPPLVGGDAVAASLITGDIEMQAIGTVTYSDDKGRFLMFGHPFFGAGATNLPVSKAYITWTYSSSQRAFKDGVRLEPTLGTMTKDHGAACGGTFKLMPDMVPVKVKIKDIDTGRDQSFEFEVMKHPDWTPMLMAMAVNQAAAEVLDRQPKGTMKLSYHVEGTGLREPLRRVNYYSNDLDVIGDGAFEIMPLANLLQNNIYREVDMTRLNVMIEVTGNRINASIDNAEIISDESDEAAEGGDDPALPPAVSEDQELLEAMNGGLDPSQQGGEEQSEEGDPLMGQMMFEAGHPMDQIPKFAPGETIRVKVKLQPYRTDPIWREFHLTVPADFPSGNTTLIVHGGGDLVSMAPLGGKGRSLFGMGPIIDITKQDFDDILDQIIEWPTNNELLITLVRPYDPNAMAASLSGDEMPDEKYDEKYQMEWVIYNGFQLPVIIASEEEQAQMEEQSSGQPGETAGDEEGAGMGSDDLLEQKRRNLERNAFED